MTNKERAIFISKKDEAYKKFFDLRMADEETCKDSKYSSDLDRALDIALVYLELAEALGL